MTDRYNALIVVLDKDIRQDDAQPIIEAIKQLRNVIYVDGNISDMSSHIAEVRAKRELVNKLFDMLK